MQIPTINPKKTSEEAKVPQKTAKRRKAKTATSREARLAKITAIAVAAAALCVIIAIGMAITTQSHMTLAHENMVAVAVAKGDVQSGEQMKLGDTYEFVEVPKAYLPEGKFTKDAANDIEGHLSGANLPSGTIVTRSLLVDMPGAVTNLSMELSGGNVAITVSADAEVGLASLIVPGDTVNVISYETGDRIASNLKVRACGSSLSNNGKDYSTVTLEASERDASAITAAQSSGGIRLVLLSAADANGGR